MKYSPSKQNASWSRCKKLLGILKDPQLSLVKASKLVNRATKTLLSSTRTRLNGSVVMFHIGRSGSTVLGDMLDQHPQIRWEGEIFERLFRSSDQGTVGESSTNPEFNALDIVRQRMRRCGGKLYGLEVKPFHLDILGVDLSDFVKGLQNLGDCYTLILERRNYLRKIVSSVVAHQTQTLHISSAKATRLTRVRLDVDCLQIDRTRRPLLEFLHAYERSFQLLENTLPAKTTLRLTYEEDVAPDPNVGYSRICSALGLPTVGCPAVRYGQTNPFPLADMLENYAEVEAALEGTSFAWMLRG